MNYDLRPDSPRPPEMPDVVALKRFEVQHPDGPVECWQLTGDQHAWTMPMTAQRLSCLLAWLDQHGYVPLYGTEPAAFRLAPQPYQGP